MADIEAFLDKYDIDPLDNPWEALALLAARALEAERILHKKIGNLEDADVTSPTVAAWERYLQIASKLVTDASKLDLDERKLTLTKAQSNLVLTGIQAALPAFAEHLNALFPGNKRLINQAVTQVFPTLLAQALKGETPQPPLTALPPADTNHPPPDTPRGSTEPLDLRLTPLP